MDTLATGRIKEVGWLNLQSVCKKGGRERRASQAISSTLCGFLPDSSLCGPMSHQVQVHEAIHSLAPSDNMAVTSLAEVVPQDHS